MKHVILVGADYVSPILEALSNLGAERVAHWPSRKPGDLRRELPEGVSLVVVLTDFVSHAMMRHMRAITEPRQVPVLYARRSLLDVQRKVGAWLVTQSGAANDNAKRRTA